MITASDRIIDMYICHLKKQVRYSGKKDVCWKSSHNHASKYMLKTFWCPIEWPASALFFLFEINNKSCFYWAGFYKRILLSVSLSSFDTTETFFLLSPSPDPLNTFGSALDLSSMKRLGLAFC